MASNSSAFIVPTKPVSPDDKIISESGHSLKIVDQSDIKGETYLFIDSSRRSNIFTRLFQIIRFIFTGKIRI